MGLFDKFFNKKAAPDSAEKGTADDSLYDMLSQKIAAGQERRNILFNGQRPNDEYYGYTMVNPICTSSVFSSAKYLSRLRTSRGEKLSWIRDGAVELEELNGIEGVIVDIYHLYLNGSFFREIFICPYSHNSSFVPKGLLLADTEADDGYGGDIVREAEERGVTPAQVLALQKLEFEETQFEMRRAEEGRKAEEEKQRILRLRARSVVKAYPEFELQKELENKHFTALVDCNIDMKTAYEYVHRAELFAAKPADSSSLSHGDLYSPDMFYDLLLECEAIESGSAVAMTPDELFARAAETGMSTQQLIAMERLNEENAKRAREEKKTKCREWAEQAAIVKAHYPAFDLEEEYKNHLFREVLYRCDVMTAYEVIHFSEIFAEKEIAPRGGHNDTDDITTGLYCRKCGNKLPLDSAFCYKCGERVIIPDNIESGYVDTYSSIFEFHFRAAIEIAVSSELADAPEIELLPAMYVVSDYAATSAKKDRVAVSDDIMEWLRANFFGKYTYEKVSLFDERVSFYGEIIRGRKLRGEWLDFDTKKYEDNPIMRCVVALGDILYNPKCAEEYNDAPIVLRGIFVRAEFASGVMSPIAKQFVSLFKQIYDLPEM